MHVHSQRLLVSLQSGRWAHPCLLTMCTPAWQLLKDPWMCPACAGFQHGFDFLSAYSDADSAPSRAGVPVAFPHLYLDGRPVA